MDNEETSYFDDFARIACNSPNFSPRFEKRKRKEDDCRWANAMGILHAMNKQQATNQKWEKKYHSLLSVVGVGGPKPQANKKRTAEMPMARAHASPFLLLRTHLSTSPAHRSLHITPIDRPNPFSALGVIPTRKQPRLVGRIHSPDLHAQIRAL